MKWVFWISVALIAHAYFAYPACLWVRSWWSPRPVRRGKLGKSVSAILVVKNEESVIADKLQNLLSLAYPPEKMEIVVVSDGSTDNTDAIVQEFARNSRVRFLPHASSRGKAAGLNDAIHAATGEILLFTDARQTIEGGALGNLVENFADPEVGCVSGELMLGDPSRGETGQGIGLYWLVEKKVRELESASGSVVGATGALYAARRELLPQIPADTILDDVYVPMHVARQGGRVVFDDRARAWDKPNLGSGREFARKVRTLTGNYQLLQLAPWLLSAGNPIRFEFVSHKLLRLLIPFALAAALVSSLLVNEPLYRVFGVLQLCFYAISILGVVRLKWRPLTRVADAAFTFVVLNAAAVVAFKNFVTGRRVAWS
jgi:poly-beta-1,6-N-acetyl-D-glucosamine synthase